MPDQNPEVLGAVRGGGHPLPPVPPRPRTSRSGGDCAGRRRGPADLRRGGPGDEPAAPGAGRVPPRGLRDGGPAPQRRLDPRPRGWAPRIEEILLDPRCVGVGETGLDFFRHGLAGGRPGAGLPAAHGPRAGRRASRSSSTSATHGPTSFESWTRVRRTRWCSTASAATPTIARECVARGYYLSFAGNMTYPKNAHLREAARRGAARPTARRDRQPVPLAAETPWTDNAPSNVTSRRSARSRRLAARRSTRCEKRPRERVRCVLRGSAVRPRERAENARTAPESTEHPFWFKFALRVEGLVGSASCT